MKVEWKDLEEGESRGKVAWLLTRSKIGVGAGTNVKNFGIKLDVSSLYGAGAKILDAP